MSTKIVAAQSIYKILDVLNLWKRIDIFLTKRWREKFLALFDLPNNGMVLDIGCGCGHTLEVFHNHKPKLNLHGIDISKDIIQQAQKTHRWGTFSVARAERLPYQDKSLSVAVSCNSLHHYDKPQKVFEEVARVLPSGGTFYINDFFPNRWSQWYHNWNGCCASYHFEKFYTKEEVKELAVKAGFLFSSYKTARCSSKTQVVELRKL